MRSHTGRFWTVLLALATGCAAAAADKPKRSSLEGYMQKLGFGVIELQRSDENKLFARAQLNGKSHAVIVDTGWSVTALDTTVADKCKTPEELGVEFSDPASGNLLTDRAVLLTIKIGSAVFQNQPAEPMALKAQGRGTAGVLGCDFLIRNHALLDCAAKRLYVRGSELPDQYKEALRKTLASSGYHKAPLKRTGDLVPICTARINETPVELIVDSGGVWTMLDDSTARNLKLLLSRTGYWVAGVQRGMKSEVLSASPKSIILGGAPLPLRGILIGVGDLKPWIPENSSHSADGILGSELLAQSGALIDFQSTNMWFVPDQTR